MAKTKSAKQVQSGSKANKTMDVTVATDVKVISDIKVTTEPAAVLNKLEATAATTSTQATNQPLKAKGNRKKDSAIISATINATHSESSPEAGVAADSETSAVASTAERSATSTWYVYLVRTSQGMLYTGISTDPARRLRQHSGELTGGAKALRGKGSLALVWQQAAANRSIASQWEFKLKQLPKKAKEQLVALQWQPEFLVVGDDASGQ